MHFSNKGYNSNSQRIDALSKLLRINPKSRNHLQIRQYHPNNQQRYSIPCSCKSTKQSSRFLYLGNKDGKNFNAPIFFLSKIIKTIMSLAVEADCGRLYINAQEAVSMRHTLIKFGHPQPHNGTLIRTDNSTADGIMN